MFTLMRIFLVSLVSCVRTRYVSSLPYPPGMVTDKEAADIRKKLVEGWRGPVLLTWLYRLLDDREAEARAIREATR